MRLPIRRRGAVKGGSATADHPLHAFHARLGSPAVTRHGALWYGAGRFSLVTSPNNQRVSATRREVQELLAECGKLAAVFCPVEGSGPAVAEYWLQGKDYGLERLQHQFRTHVRAHLSQFVTRELTWDEMAASAGAIHADVARRRRASTPAFTDPRRWAGVCETAAGIAGLVPYGCLRDASLAGYVVAWRADGACHGVLMNRDSRFDAMRAGNVMMYGFTRDQIARPDTSTINMGRSWYPPQPSLNAFKRHAGYEERQTTVAVVLHPALESTLLSAFARRCLRGIAALSAGRASFANDLQLLEAARLTDIP